MLKVTFTHIQSGLISDTFFYHSKYFPCFSHFSATSSLRCSKELGSSDMHEDLRVVSFHNVLLDI